MTGYLLDTNAVLILALRSRDASQSTLAALESGRRFVSQVCAIEIAIKQGLGKLALPPPFQTHFANAFARLASELSADILPIALTHIDTLSHLPLHHRDPFDRLIIAQALTEGLTVVTNDRAFAAYDGLNILEV